MTDTTSNGGGYGNPGAQAQSQQQARAQQYDSPSAEMADNFESQGSPVMDEAVDGTGMGLHNQSEAFRSQTQIAYQDGTSVSAQGLDEEE